MSPEEVRKIAQDVEKLLKTDALKITGIEAKKHFQESFQKGKEGFTDEKLEPWTPLKPATEARKKRANGSMPPILTNKGHLRDSINWNADYNKQEVSMSSDKPYAQIHNEGGTISGTQSVKAHTRKGKDVKAHSRSVKITIPKRQFMGHSKALEKKIIDKIEKQLSKILGS